MHSTTDLEARFASDAPKVLGISRQALERALETGSADERCEKCNRVKRGGERPTLADLGLVRNGRQ